MGFALIPSNKPPPAILSPVVVPPPAVNSNTEALTVSDHRNMISSLLTDFPYLSA